MTHSKCRQHHSKGELGLSSLVQKLREKRSSKYRRTPKRKLCAGKVKKSLRACWDLWLPREQKSLPLRSFRPWAPQQEWQWLLQKKKSRKGTSVLSKSILGIFKVKTGTQHSTQVPFYRYLEWAAPGNLHPGFSWPGIHLNCQCQLTTQQWLSRQNWCLINVFRRNYDPIIIVPLVKKTNISGYMCF